MHYTLFNTQLRLICNRANEQPGVSMDNTVFLGGCSQTLSRPRELSTPLYKLRVPEWTHFKEPQGLALCKKINIYELPANLHDDKSS